MQFVGRLHEGRKFKDQLQEGVYFEDRLHGGFKSAKVARAQVLKYAQREDCAGNIPPNIAAPGAYQNGWRRSEKWAIGWLTW